MSEILFAYEKVEATTWAYLSSLLMIGLFFKFNRFWSVRNADLVLLILLAPGLLLVHYGEQEVAREFAYGVTVASEVPSDAVDVATGDVSIDAQARAVAPTGTEGPTLTLIGDDEPLPSRLTSSQFILWLGYAMLLGAGVLLLLRLLIDPTMVRRPLLEPNLTTGGLAFIGCSLFMFLMANVINSAPAKDPASTASPQDDAAAGETTSDVASAASMSVDDPPQSDEKIVDASPTRSASSPTSTAGDDESLIQRHGPGYLLLNALPQVVTMPSGVNSSSPSVPLLTTTKIMAIVSHLLIVLGMVAIGYRHFGNLRMGIGGATMYLMLPYTAVMTGLIDHAAPAALLTWAIVFYRRPLTAGICLGLAGGMIYYPLFVLPLWISFYWQRGMGRFISGLACALAVMVLALAAVHFAGVQIESISPTASFMEKLSMMFGIWPPRMSGLEGVWVDKGPLDPIYRTPIIFAFVGLSGTFAVWPAQKNLGTLLSCTTAMMVAAQCWHGSGGGVYMGWYLPLMLMTFLRPNLEDRVALSVLSEGWFPRRARMESSLAA